MNKFHTFSVIDFKKRSNNNKNVKNVTKKIKKNVEKRLFMPIIN